LKLDRYYVLNVQSVKITKKKAKKEKICYLNKEGFLIVLVK